MAGLFDLSDLLGVETSAPEPTGRRTILEPGAPSPTGGLGIVPILLPEKSDRQTSTIAAGGRRTTTTAQASPTTTSSARPSDTGSSSSSSATTTITSASETPTKSDASPTSQSLSSTPLPSGPVRIEDIISTLGTSTPSPAISAPPQAQVTDGGGMNQQTIMAVAIAAPVASISLIGIVVLVCWTKKRKERRRREEQPYDEEFESLKSKHEKKFGVGHNY